MDMIVPPERALERLVIDCCRELLSAYGLDVEVQSGVEVQRERLLCGVLGFGGAKMRGAVVFVANREALEHTNPGGTSHRDWICELSNQLAGRVKNKLLALGIEILLATPAGLSGESLSPSGLAQRSALAGRAGLVYAWCDYELVDGFEYPSAPSADGESAVGEGEMILF